MIATAGVLKNVDAAPLWFRELKILGSCEQGHEKYKDSVKSTYSIAIEMLQEKKISLKQLVTHKFRLKDFKDQGYKVTLLKEYDFLEANPLAFKLLRRLRIQTPSIFVYKIQR